MNIISGAKDGGGDVEHKLSVWRLKNREWQLVSQSSSGFIDFPVMMKPSDGNTMYMWREMYESLASIKLSNGKSRVHDEVERNVVETVRYEHNEFFLSESYFSMFALPRWLYRIRPPTTNC